METNNNSVETTPDKKTFRVWRMVEVWYSTSVEADSEEDAISEVEDINLCHMDEGNIEFTDVYNVVELDEDGDEIGEIVLYRDGELIGDLLDVKGYTVNYEL